MASGSLLRVESGDGEMSCQVEGQVYSNCEKFRNENFRNQRAYSWFTHSLKKGSS